jgi:uncharacterized protein YciI
MKPFLLALLTICLNSCNDSKQESKQTTDNKEKSSSVYDLESDTTVYSEEMKRFWLVLLKKGPNRNQDSTSRAKIQAAHLGNIGRLAKEGKIIMAGPIGVDNDLQGIFLMNCKDSTEVAQFVNTDTAVITGRLVMEYYPWWSAKGKFIFK